MFSRDTALQASGMRYLPSREHAAGCACAYFLAVLGKEEHSFFFYIQQFFFSKSADGSRDYRVITNKQKILFSFIILVSIDKAYRCMFFKKSKQKPTLSSLIYGSTHSFDIALKHLLHSNH